MSGGAIAGAAVVGAGASIYSSKQASKSADSATAASSAAAAAQNEASMAQLDFQKQQYADWENIFGPIQQNLSSYYQSLNADTFTSLGLQNIEQQYVKSRQNLDTVLAQRGITNSGATVAGLTQLESARMLGKAEVQSNAPAQVAQQKLGFLSAGLGLQGGLTSGISNAYTNQMNMLGQQSTAQMNQANQYASQAAAGYAGVGSSIGAGINTYMMANTMQQPTATANTGFVGNMTQGWWS